MPPTSLLYGFVTLLYEFMQQVFFFDGHTT
jgi:hypothetical protein